MSINTELYKQEFNMYYHSTFEKKNNSGKAFKDVAGAEYETFRRKVWQHAGYQLSKPNTKFANWKADIIIKHNNKIIAVEEDKAHYVDSCFLDRFYSSAAKVVSYCLKNKIEIPYIILSCPTSYSLFDKKKNEILQIYRSDIVHMLDVKVKYLTICNHDRVAAKNYFVSNTNCFYLDNEKIRDNIEAIKRIIE